jgi:hypothetical protein
MGAASVGRFVPVLYQHDIILGVMGTPVGEKKIEGAGLLYSTLLPKL